MNSRASSTPPEGNDALSGELDERCCGGNNVLAKLTQIAGLEERNMRQTGRQRRRRSPQAPDSFSSTKDKAVYTLNLADLDRMGSVG